LRVCAADVGLHLFSSEANPPHALLPAPAARHCCRARRGAPTLCSALVPSLPSAGAQGLSARRTFRTRTSAPCALQCKHSRLASALNWRLACPHLAPAWPWHLCGWGGGGPRRLWALLPCDAWRQPWLASSVRGAAASCAMGLHGARHCVDRRRRLRARVPLAPPCPASVVGLV